MDRETKIREYQKTRNKLAGDLAGELSERQRGNYAASFEQLSDEISYLLSHPEED